MKTTLNLDDELLLSAKRRARAQGTTLTKVIEEGLRTVLADEPQATFHLDLPVVRGTRPPAADPGRRDAIYDVLDGVGGAPG